jgi:cytoskeletal protein RodZ
MVSLAKRFHLTRERQHITIEQASKALRIRSEFLQAIETGNYAKLPTAYAYGFVGNYAQYLGMPKQQTIAMFRREFDEKKSYSVLPSSMARTKEFKVKRMRVQQTMVLIVGIFFLIGAYILYQYRFVFLSPPLTVSKSRLRRTCLASGSLLQCE